MPTQQKNLRAIAEFLVVGICTLAFALTAVGICSSLLGRDAAGSRDFVEYWVSGHQLAHHANPYDAGAILPMERTVGFPLRASPTHHGQSTIGSIVGASAWFPWPGGRRVPMVAAPACLSRGFGADGLDHARPSEESASLARIFVRACPLMFTFGSDHPFLTAGAGFIPAFASVPSVHGWSLSVALHAQASLVLALRRRAARMGDDHSKS